MTEEEEHSLKSALQAVHDHKGQLTAEDVVEVAKDPNSFLHQYFQWDDEKAAHQHRLFVARALIRRIKIKVETKPDTFVQVRAYTHVKSTGTYVTTSEALRHHGDLVLREARTALQSLRRKYQALVDFDSLLREELARGSLLDDEGLIVVRGGDGPTIE